MMVDEVEVERVGAVTTCLRPSLSSMKCRIGSRGWFDVGDRSMLKLPGE